VRAVTLKPTALTVLKFRSVNNIYVYVCLRRVGGVVRLGAILFSVVGVENGGNFEDSDGG
jgi:hypothetical protein